MFELPELAFASAMLFGVVGLVYVALVLFGGGCCRGFVLGCFGFVLTW